MSGLAFVIVFGGYALLAHLIATFDPQLRLGVVGNLSVALAIFISPIVLAWLWWSISAPRWRIWALARNRDWPLLERLAIDAGLIWNERKFFGRILTRSEIWTPVMRRQFANLRRAGAED